MSNMSPEFIEAVVNEFNTDIDGTPLKKITTKSIFGIRINTDEYRVVSKNQEVQLVKPTQYRVRLHYRTNTNDLIEDRGIIKQTNLYFGVYGKHLLNVPLKHLCWTQSGNQTRLYGPGTHVIKDENLNEITDDNLVPIGLFNNPLNTDNDDDDGEVTEKKKKKKHMQSSDPVINVNDIYIIWVKPGKLGRITINNKPYLLIPRKKPYVFK